MIMKTILRVTSLISLLLVLAIPGLAFAQDEAPQDQIVLGGNYTLPSGESVANLTVVGGNAVLEEGSTVVDTVTMIGGNLTINGVVSKNIHIYGGQLTLGDKAVVSGDIYIGGGNLDRSEGAQVDGSVTRTTELPFNFNLPETPVITVPRYLSGLDPIVSQIFWFGMQTIGLTALAMLVILLAPKVTERAGDAAMARPWAAGGLGLLVAIITPPLALGLTITVIGIPVTVLLVIAVSVVLTFGWIALGLEVGKRLAEAFHQNWPAVMNVGLGTLLLSLVANGIGLIACVGWIVPALVGFVGMGGVLLSRFGTQTYPPVVSVAPVAVV
jgi:hypothetical protein